MTHTIEVTPEEQMSAVIDFLNRTGNGDMADKVRDLARHRTEALSSAAGEPAPSSQRALVEALEELEAACDALAATRSQETYLRMIDVDKAYDALVALDEARTNARSILAALSLTKAQERGE
ncbi:MAG: hypothetical protein ACK4Z8_04985 [Novosphingobium sp.]